MKWLGFFYILTSLNFAVADSFNYASFSGSFSVEETAKTCATRSKANFDGTRLVLLSACTNNSDRHTRIFVCEGRVPKCKIDKSFPQNDSCEKNELQFLASGDFLSANPCTGSTVFYSRDPSQPAPVISEANEETATQLQPETQTEKPENNEGRFD